MESRAGGKKWSEYMEGEAGMSLEERLLLAVNSETNYAISSGIRM